ncbi:TM2 domain-containing protein [Hufsiella ginkgonis]|uniref:NINE protein n=1 Tax=Hufsiella ginkgonis TaxID=2695274 RepID=A0A7K1XT58_9SPHI|nr:TM2 domain-containing protein [Hufsiella ginkgonis]MXV14144.1 NINE protein [Hufsiella ginkgonis]
MHQDFLGQLKGITPEEYAYLQHTMTGMTDEQAKQFVLFYSGRRKSAQDILLFTLIGLLGIGGIQRFVTGQTGMGILYILTIGLCYIGTIVDLINHQSIARDYNEKTAYESANMVRVMYPAKGI